MNIQEEMNLEAKALKIFSEKDDEIFKSAEYIVECVEREFSYQTEKLKDLYAPYKDSLPGEDYLNFNLSYAITFKILKKLIKGCTTKEMQWATFQMLQSDIAEEIDGPLTEEQIHEAAKALVEKLDNEDKVD